MAGANGAQSTLLKIGAHNAPTEAYVDLHGRGRDFSKSAPFPSGPDREREHLTQRRDSSLFLTEIAASRRDVAFAELERSSTRR